VKIILRDNFILVTITLLTIFLFMGVCFAEEVIKYSVFSGSFYPNNRELLIKQINFFLDNVEDDIFLKDKKILGLISPHAGYEYSGQVAAYGYKAVKGREYDTVIVLGPSHRYSFNGISVYREGCFRTPLGDIQIDKELTEELLKYDERIKFIPEAFSREHSIEVQLPFLQVVLPSFKLVPIILGNVDLTDCKMLADALKMLSQKKNILVIASSDLSHYHPYIQAEILDKRVASYVERLDSLGLWNAVNKNECELCGLFAVLVLLDYARDAGFSSRVLKYANSGDVISDKSAVVGYLSCAFYQQEQNKDSLTNKGEKMFTKEQKIKLLSIARNSIKEYLLTGRRPKIDIDEPDLKVQRGAFVTLKKNGQLRGCIGSFTSNQPLYLVVSNMAIEAAVGDPRFPELSLEELDQVEVEISVLTEPELIDDWRKIRLGIDGVIVRRGFSSGVFLPQVATETGWDLETFLRQLCSGKAGLPADCYKDPKTQIYTFQAIVFSESEIK